MVRSRANDYAIVSRSRSCSFLGIFVFVLLFGNPVCDILKEVDLIKREERQFPMQAIRYYPFHSPHRLYYIEDASIKLIEKQNDQQQCQQVDLLRRHDEFDQRLWFLGSCLVGSFE